MPNKQVQPTPIETVKAGRRIRNRRTGLYGTLQEAEKLTGISFQILSSLERGQMTRPSMELLSRVSLKFRIPITLLLDWYGYEAYVGEPDKDLLEAAKS